MHIKRHKTMALLAYLAVSGAGKSHSREGLVTLLSPDLDPSRARATLRRCLSDLNQVLDNRPVIADRETVVLDLRNGIWVDVNEFSQRLAECDAHDHVGIEACADCLPQLDAAVALYSDDFMAGFSLGDSLAFDEWQYFQAEELRDQFAGALVRLARYHTSQGDFETAIACARRWLAVDPTHEPAHQHLMALYAQSGQRAAALRQYEVCRRTLSDELGVEPSAKIREMYERLAAGDSVVGPSAVEAVLERELRTVGPCPYRGLAAFREEDAAFFFGREGFVERLFQAVHERSFVATIVGSSGSGKSSAVYAGLLPRLREEGAWLISDLRPDGRPYDALAAAVLSFLEPALSETERLIETRKLAGALSEGRVLLDDVVERTLTKNPGAQRLLLVVDQFEELYTLCPEPQVRRHFLDALLVGVEQAHRTCATPFGLLITLRADFMDQALTHRAFADTLQTAVLMMGPMTRDELQAAIEKPAQKQGAGLEAGLVERLLDDVGEEPGNLPLLEFALTLLWERLDYGWMTHAAYEGIGRVEGALARYADEVYAELDEEERERARQIFVQLVQPGEGTQDTRRAARRVELGDIHWALVQYLADKRLVVTGRDLTTGEERAEVGHEALIQRWGRLRHWMEEDRAFRTWQERLRAGMRGWEASGRDDGALLRGVPLAEAESWLVQRGDELGQAERDYIRAGVELRQSRRAEREQRRRRTVLALAGGLVLAVALALAALFFARKSEQDRRVADQERQVAEEQERLAQARALAGAATSNLQVDPNLSLLLAMQAVDTTYSVDGTWEPEAVDALHRALGPTGRLQHTLDGAGESWGWIQYSPDGARIGASFELDSGESVSKVWDAATGEELLSVPGENIQISPDGSRLATLVWENWENNEVQVRVWDANTGDDLQTYPVRLRIPGNLSGAWLMADWEHMVAHHRDGRVDVYDIATGSLIPDATMHTSPVDFLVCTEDSRYVATHSLDGAIRIWALPSGDYEGPDNQEPLVTLADRAGPFTWYSFSPDGQYLMTVCDDFTAELWDVTVLVKSASVEEALLATYELDEHASEIKWIAFSPDSKLLATTSDDGLVTVRRTFSGKVVLTLVLTDELRGVAFDREATHVAVVGMTGKVQILDITPTGDAEWLALAAHDGWVYKVAYSPDGAMVASASWDGTAKLWDAHTGELLHTLGGHTDRVNSVAFSPDGRYLATASGDATAKIWNVATGEDLFTLKRHIRGHGSLLYGVIDVAYSPDGERLVTVGWDETVSIWDAVTGRHLLTVGECALSVAFSPDGNLFAGGCWQPINVWESSSLHADPVFQFAADDLDFPMDVAFSPDSALLAGAHPDGMVSLWDVTAPDDRDRERHVTTLTGSRGIVRSVAFSPDGQQLAASSADVTRVFDLDSGQQLYSLPGHSKTVFDVAFSPDGTRLVSGSLDGTIRVYVLPIDELMALARARLTRGLTESECQQYSIEPCPDG